MEARLNVITLGVNNLEKSKRFYGNGLGFPIAKISNSNVVFFKTSGVRLALYPAAKLAEDANLPFDDIKPAFTGITIAYNAKTKAEVDEILTLAQTAGGKLLKPAQDVFWGGYSGYFSDPDGHIWEVAYADFWKFDNQANLVLE